MPTSTALAGFTAQVFLTVSPSVNIGTLAMTDSGDHKTWNPSNLTKQCWDDASSFTVQTSTDGGTTWVTASPSTYKINYPIGQVVFASPVGGTPAVRITNGNYFTNVFVAGCKEWDGTATMSPLEATAQQNPPSPWKTFAAGLNSAQLKLSKLFQGTNTIFSQLTIGTRIVLLLYTGANVNQRFQGYVILNKYDLKALVSAAETDDNDWTVTGQLFFTPS